MNIKNIAANPVLPVDPKNRIEGGVRAKSSTDRDANGKREDGGGEPEKKKLTEQEFEEALKVLKALPGLQTSHLSLRVEIQDGVRMVYIEDANGKVVRRLTEAQLWSSTRDKDKQTGTLFDKAM